jgi:hypothetical protein
MGPDPVHKAIGFSFLLYCNVVLDSFHEVHEWKYCHIYH